MKDDIFFEWRFNKNTTIDEFREYLNYIKPRIQFTSEIEKDRVLNFANLAVKRMDDRFSDRRSNENTHFRSYELCTLKEDRKEEHHFLKDTFIANDCPQM